MLDKKLERDFKHLSATNDYLELARQDAIALAESFKQERDQLREAAEKLAEALEFAQTILLLVHPELSNVEMNTLTTRQYMIWSRSDYCEALADYRKQFLTK
jgi:septal ring factor EnvC (AmiA/AmiB activator)